MSSDWGDTDDLPESQLEAALHAAELAYASRCAAGGEVAGPAAAAPQPAQAVAAHPHQEAAPSEALSTANEAPPARRRRLPSSLDAPVPATAGGAAPKAARPTSAGGVAGDENLPPAAFPGRSRYAFTSYEVDSLCQAVLSSGVGAVGFDIEWRVTYQTGVPPRPVALIQFCMPHASSASAAGHPAQQQAQKWQQAQQAQQHQCLLLHVAHSGITPHLRTLLCTQDVLKVGVGAWGDALKLRRDFGLEMAGVVCLSEYANARLVSAPPAANSAQPEATAPAAATTVAVGANQETAVNGFAGGDGAAAQEPGMSNLALSAPQKWSLAALVCHLMRLRLEKSQQLRCGNWEVRPPLSQEQQVYAATDAWASLRCYEILSKMPVVTTATTTTADGQLSGGQAPACAAQLEVAVAAEATAAADAAAHDWVPACAVLRHLQPAKLAVYQALVQQGLSVQQVAAQRRIREDSVQGYMAEAISAGLGYSWSCLGVPLSALQLVCSTCSELLGRQLAWQATPPISRPPEQQQQGGCGPAQQQPQQAQQQQQAVAVGSKRPPPCSPGSLAAALGPARTGSGDGLPACCGSAAAPAERNSAAGTGAATAAAAAAIAGVGADTAAGTAATAAGGTTATPAGSAAAADGEPVDVLDLLLAVGHTMRELNEQRFEEVGYGHLRLAMAHLGRCNLGPWE